MPKIITSKISHNSYQGLISSISGLLSQARTKAIRQVNSILTETYRNIGKQVVEYE